MVTRFVAYIDEAGDTGLNEVKHRTNAAGASEWLLLGCVLIKVEDDVQCATWVNDITKRFTASRSPILHYRNLIPAKREIACRSIAEIPCTVFVIASNKKNIEQYKNTAAELVSGKSSNWLYWWLARVLLEKVTDHCKRYRAKDDVAPKLQLIFSQRRMRYSDFRDYLKKLRRQSKFGKLHITRGDIQWDFIDEDDRLLVLKNEDRPGLQLADVVASSFFQSLEHHRDSGCDPRFAKCLKDRLAQDKKGQVLGYGLKTLPDLWEMDLADAQHEIFEFFGYSKRGWKRPRSPNTTVEIKP